MCTVGKFAQSRSLLLGLGGNVAGCWGTPGRTFARALHELEDAGVRIVRVSNYCMTDPVSDLPQPRYLNAVLLARTSMAPGGLLRLLKRIERKAGRKTARSLAARPLDLDILDYGGRRNGRQAGRRERGRLILPHPEMHKRAFVLVPLLEVAPAWRHPVSGLGARELLMHLPPSSRASVWQALDSPANTCEKTAR